LRIFIKNFLQAAKEIAGKERSGMNRITWKRGLLVMLLVFGLFLSGCSTITKENMGSFGKIGVPGKDFVSKGIVFSETVLDDSASGMTGDIFTYYRLLQEAQKVGGDAIVNVSIDVKYDQKSFLIFDLSRTETWYGSALAIQYTDALKNVVTITEGGTVIQEGAAANSSSDGGGNSFSSPAEKKGLFGWGFLFL
jgi:hypothetical protein